MTRATLLLSAVAPTLTLASFTGMASAQVWVDANRLDGKLPDWVDEKYVRPLPEPARPPSPRPGWEPGPGPAPGSRYERVWVEPVYRTVRKRVWVEPVCRVVYGRVWVPPRHEWRETVYWENGVKVIRREHVCVAPGRWEMHRHEIVERPGYWTVVEERELVSGGYWKLVPVR